MRHRTAHNPPAVVLSFDGFAEAYDIVRALGMAGIPSVVATSRARNIAYYSRYCEGRIPLAAESRGERSGIVEQLLAFSERAVMPPVLFYVSDPELSFVRRHRDVLAPRFRFLLPPEATLEQLCNKVLFTRFARAYELPVPATMTVRTGEELASACAGIQFPCIVKPAFTHDWEWESDELRERFGTYKEALRRFSSPDELLRFCDGLPTRGSGYCIQSYIDGRDETIVSFHGYFDESSRCLAHFVGRKIRTYPPHTGGSVYIRTIRNPELASRSIAFLQRIGFRGIVKIDYKWSEALNEYLILEINPRYNLWELLGAYAGVNLASLAYRHQMRELVDGRSDYRDGVHLLFLKQDFRAFLGGYRKSGEWSYVSYARSLGAKTFFRVFTAKDPVPFVVSAASFAARNIFRIGKRGADAERRDLPAGRPDSLPAGQAEPSKKTNNIIQEKFS